MGCGPQEQFYGCADISIANGGISTQKTSAPTTKQPTIITTKQPTVITTKQPTAITTKQPTVTTTKQPIVTTTTQGETTFTCVKDGLFAYNYCTQFYQCVYTNTPNAFKVLQSCPSGTLFDQSIQVCNWAAQVKCGNDAVTTSSPTKMTTVFPQTTSTNKPTTGKTTSVGPNTLVKGFYWWSWSQNIIPPSGINMGVCFR